MMNIEGADHTNWRVKDIDRSLRFYRDMLGLEPFGLEEFKNGDRSLVSLRVTPSFIIHLQPDLILSLNLREAIAISLLSWKAPLPVSSLSV